MTNKVQQTLSIDSISYSTMVPLFLFLHRLGCQFPAALGIPCSNRSALSGSGRSSWLLEQAKNNDKIAGNSYASYSNGPAGRLCLRWMAGSARFGAGCDWGQSRLLFRTVTRRSSQCFIQGSWVTRLQRGMEDLIWLDSSAIYDRGSG